MKNVTKFCLALIIAVMGLTIDSNAQIYIKIRPARPHYERVVAPTPRHIWIEEDWESRNGTYVFIGGHWIEPPRPNVVWVPGHWRHRPRGWVWIPGHWRG